MSHHRPSLHAALIAAVTLIAVLINGSTSDGTRQIVLLLMAGTIILAPPQNRHGNWLTALALMALAVPFS